MEDVEQTKRDEEEQKRKEAKAKYSAGWFSRVPQIFKLAGFGIIFIKFLAIRNAHGNMMDLWPWVIGVVIMWYFLGRDLSLVETGILSPAEADDAARKEIMRKKKDGAISMNAKTTLGPNNGLYFLEGMPVHYQIELTIEEDGFTEYKRVIVNAKGEAKGYATIQSNAYRLSGREAIPKITPGWIKNIRNYDLNLKDFAGKR